MVLPVPPGPVSVSRRDSRKQPFERLELHLATDERGQALRAVGQAGSTPLRRGGKSLGRPGDLELEQRLRLGTGP